MNLSAEQIQSNWEEFLGYIEIYISSPRKEKLLEFYKKHEEEIIMMPASHKKAYHNAFPGGYIDHVNRVIIGSLAINDTWVEFGAEQNYTIEELVFSAMNHDLGKMGDGKEYSHKPSQDEWRKKNLGEMYEFNKKLSFMSVPERSIKLLVDAGITPTENEWLAIRLHDGLYDPANEPYLKSWMPELKPRTSLIYIIHQADLMAARIEFEKEWMPKLYQTQKPKSEKKSNVNMKTKTLGSIKSEGLKNMLNSL